MLPNHERFRRVLAIQVLEFRMDGFKKLLLFFLFVFGIGIFGFDKTQLKIENKNVPAGNQKP